MICSRRDLLRGLAAGAACAGCRMTGGNADPDAGVASDAMCPQVLCVSLANPSNAALRSVGGAQTFHTPHDSIILVRTTDTTIVALSDICTHAGCGLNYFAPRNELTCPCHGSIFSITGAVMRGPAFVALRVYTATLDATTNEVTVT
jgi:cytochrome b6-f complex iron-sulfur subunit